MTTPVTKGSLAGLLDFGLTGRRAVVAGAGEGMGRACALTLAAAGCSVVCADLDQERAAKVASEIIAAGGKAAPFAGDVTQRSTVEALRDAAIAELGGVDVVVDIIGQSIWGGLFATSDERWERNYQMNLQHGFLITKVFAEYLRDERIDGRFVHMASVGGMAGYANNIGYGAFKAGLISLIRATSVELARFGIRINGVAPGTIETPRTKFTDEAFKQKVLDSVPLHRQGSVQDIANLVLFLASDLSSYITGQTIVIDGGSMGLLPFPDPENFTPYE